MKIVTSFMIFLVALLADSYGYACDKTSPDYIRCLSKEKKLIPPEDLQKSRFMLNAYRMEDRIKAIENIGSQGFRARQKDTNLLIKKLKDRDEPVRLSAIDALGNINRSAKRAVPELIKLLDHKYVNVRNAAALSLQKIGSKRAIKAIKKSSKITDKHKKDIQEDFDFWKKEQKKKLRHRGMIGRRD